MIRNKLVLNSKILAWGWIFAGIISIGAASTPVATDTPHFGTIKLSPGFPASKGKAAGYTGGTFPLSVISKRDGDGNPCIGFADPTPDYIMILSDNFSRLDIEVNSGNFDTTLVIQGPNDRTVRCGDDTRKSKDASITGKKWKAGKYKIWVGIFNQGVKRNYTLSVRES
ncbi:MAG: hypothetical protein QNJ47_20880 [Nostocaceae cyanobacterium]|nr:hypothetical protein [Nostocaceae cyanobacterium]